jgi:hypothetical protein
LNTVDLEVLVATVDCIVGRYHASTRSSNLNALSPHALRLKR